MHLIWCYPIWKLSVCLKIDLKLKIDANNAYYLNSYVQEVPVAYILSLVLTFLNILYVWGFLLFSAFFQGKFLGFSS